MPSLEQGMPTKLDLVQSFKKAADTKSFTAAAQELGMTPSALSRQITRLENNLGVQLFVRSTRHIHLTDAGSVFYKRCSNGLAELDLAWVEVKKLQNEPQGLLRIRATPCFGKLHIASALIDFLKIYPKVSVDLSLGHWEDNFMSSGIDLLIRSATFTENKKVAFHVLAGMRHIICASPKYIETHGKPKVPSDLVHHNCLIANQYSARNEWPFDEQGRKRYVRVSGNFRADNLEAVQEAVTAGLGIARLPNYVVGPQLRDGTLCAIFPSKGAGGASTSTNTMKAFYNRSQFNDPKKTALVSFLQARFKKNYDWERRDA
jgi:DNA-binding transcriptional LysR family regulator